MRLLGLGLVASTIVIAMLGVAAGCGNGEDGTGGAVSSAGQAGSGGAGEAGATSAGAAGKATASAGGSSVGSASGGASGQATAGASAGESVGGSNQNEAGAPAGGTGSALLDCNPAHVACKLVPGECSGFEVRAVEGTCWGECVPIAQCACSVAADCPDNNEFTCWSKRHCGPYVK